MCEEARARLGPRRGCLLGTPRQDASLFVGLTRYALPPPTLAKPRLLDAGFQPSKARRQVQSPGSEVTSQALLARRACLLSKCILWPATMPPSHLHRTPALAGALPLAIWPPISPAHRRHCPIKLPATCLWAREPRLRGASPVPGCSTQEQVADLAAPCQPPHGPLSNLQAQRRSWFRHWHHHLCPPQFQTRHRLCGWS